MRARGPEHVAEPELTAGFHGRPGAAPGVTYRLLRGFWRVVGAILRLHLVVEGREHLPVGVDGRPDGGWIAAVIPHRTWIDPFLPWIALPVRPRLAFFGDARTMARSPLRRFVMARLGGVIPIPAARDPETVAIHLEAAREALAAGMVFCLMPETGPASPPGRIRRLGGGIGYIALRNRAPIVPVILGGNDEVYLGRRMLLRILPPLDPIELAGLSPAGAGASHPGGDDAGLPKPGSPAERAAVHRLLAALADRVADDVMAAHEVTRPGPGEPRRLRFLTTLFR